MCKIGSKRQRVACEPHLRTFGLKLRAGKRCRFSRELLKKPRMSGGLSTDISAVGSTDSGPEQL